jgi:hypothetical protein
MTTLEHAVRSATEQDTTCPACDGRIEYGGCEMCDLLTTISQGVDEMIEKGQLWMDMQTRTVWRILDVDGQEATVNALVDSGNKYKWDVGVFDSTNDMKLIAEIRS